jgi:hypothetical protein
MRLVYVAGKLNADAVGYVKNMNKMIVAADLLRRAGYAVIVPCLDFVCGLVGGDYEYEDYFENNQEALKRCDEIYVLKGWESSEGTKKEIALAKKLKIKVTYEGV